MRGKIPSPFGPNAADNAYSPAFFVERPENPAGSVLFASPHSGSEYPSSMREALRIPLINIRRTEDAFVDALFSEVPILGATLVRARYGRGFVDLNRDPRELDPDMFLDGPPRACGAPTARVQAGLGCLPKISAYGEPVYARRMTKKEGEQRLKDVHDAYHGCLRTELACLKDSEGEAVLIDCHSMPSTQPGGRILSDFVLGDRFGSSCDARLTGLVERTLKSMGYSVVRNAPYAGGYTTRKYGRPRRGLHALQIEINRGLYMDESRLVPTSGFYGLKQDITALCRLVLDFSSQALAA